MRTKFYLMTVLFLFLVSFSAGARVRLCIQSPPIVSVIPLFWMKEKGCLDEEVDLKVIVSSGHQAGLSLIDREEIQILVTGVNVGARAYNAGIGINLLNVNVWGIDYLLTYGFKADNWKDLKGKTLCLPLKGGPLDFVVRYLIGKTKINIEEINLLYKPLPQGAKYFQMGELDAIVLPEPLVTITLKNTPQAKLSLDIQKEWAKYHQDDRRIPFVGLFASSTFLEQHPELTEEFRLLYLEGVRWVNQNQKEAAELAGKYLKIPPDIFEKAFQRIHFECIASQESRNIVQEYLEEILKVYPELIYGRLPDEEFYQ